MSLPPLMSVAELLEHGAVTVAGLRGVFGGSPNPGKPATVVTGDAFAGGGCRLAQLFYG